MSRSFNGTSDNIITSTSSVLNPTSGGLSVGGWCNFSSLSNAHSYMVIARDNITGGRAYALAYSNYASPQNTWQWYINPSGTIISYLQVVSINTWYHVCGTADGSGNIAMYINGVSQGGTAAAQTFATSTGPTTIGWRDFSGFTEYFPGLLADIFAYNTNLSAGEVASLAQGARPPQVRQQSLVGYWPLDGLQSPEPDLSGNSFNGTLTGTTPGSNGPPFAMFTPRWPIVTASGPAAPAIEASGQNIMRVRQPGWRW